MEKGSSGTVRLFRSESRRNGEAYCSTDLTMETKWEIYDWEHLEDQAGIFAIHYLTIKLGGLLKNIIGVLGWLDLSWKNPVCNGYKGFRCMDESIDQIQRSYGWL